MSRIIAIMNQKGGVGKTTTAINLGAALAEAGRRVLLIDLDPQANLTRGLGLQAEALERSVYEALTDPRALLENTLIPTAWERLHLVPSHIDLSGAEIEMVSMYARETRLQRALGELPARYDYILIDCLPSLSLLTVNAMTSAREIFIPIQAHPFALEGLTKLFEIFELIREQLNPSLRVSGVLITMFDTRTNVSRQVVERLREDPRTAGKIFQTVVRVNIKIAESQGVGQPVTHYAPDCHGAQAYRALAQEVLRMPAETATDPASDAAGAGLSSASPPVEAKDERGPEQASGAAGDP